MGLACPYLESASCRAFRNRESNRSGSFKIICSTVMTSSGGKQMWRGQGLAWTPKTKTLSAEKTTRPTIICPAKPVTVAIGLFLIAYRPNAAMTAASDVGRPISLKRPR